MSAALPLYITSPSVPTEAELSALLRTALESRRLSNAGPLNHQLKLRLSEMLKVPHLALTSNGTAAIEVVARALEFHGKVITTPFTFPATAAALIWTGATPVFVDVEEDFLTIDPNAVEQAMDESVSGILGVHVYGNPCDVVRLDAISKKHRIRLAYDGAHAFGTTYDNVDISRYGDATTFSFHATKIFTTAEGGAICVNSPELHRKIELLSNFGIESEDSVADIGINAKMSEIHAAFGLANLLHYHDDLEQRREIRKCYDEAFANLKGISTLGDRPGISNRLQYYVIRVRDGKRDSVQSDLKSSGVFARRYFYPLLSDIKAYRQVCPSASNPFPNATRAAAEVLALPLSASMKKEDALRVARIIKTSIT